MLSRIAEIELLKALDSAKKELYSMFRINWQMKDKIHLKFGEGSFTVNKLIKNYGMDTNNLNLILFAYKDQVFLCKNGEFSKELLLRHNYLISNIYAKKYFVHFRKNCEFFLLISIEKSATNSNKESVDIQDFLSSNDIYNAKFKVKRVPGKMHKVLVNNARLSVFKDTSSYICDRWNFYSIENNIDKSGYYKSSFQRRLLNKLGLIKQNKAAYYIKEHYQQDISTLQESLKDLKTMYSKTILTVSTANILKGLSDIVSLPYLYQDVENIQTYSINTINASNKYLSYSDTNKYLSAIKKVQLNIEKGIKYINYVNTLNA